MVSVVVLHSLRGRLVKINLKGLTSFVVTAWMAAGFECGYNIKHPVEKFRLIHKTIANQLIAGFFKLWLLRTCGHIQLYFVLANI